MDTVNRPVSGVRHRLLGTCAREIRHRPVSLLLAVYACAVLTVIATLLANAVHRIPVEPLAVQGWGGWSALREPVLEIDGVEPEPVRVEIVGEPAVRLKRW